MAIKSVSIRIEEEMLKKIGYVAEYEGRSGSGQIMYLIRKCIADYEREHGAIDIEK